MTRTRWIIIAFTVAIVAVDAFLAVTYGKDATISVTLTKWGTGYPFIPFAWGVLTGHFWAQNKGTT